MKTPKQVKCKECKHYIDRKDAQEVEVWEPPIVFPSWFYCPMHEKKYQRVVYQGVAQYRVRTIAFARYVLPTSHPYISYYREVECDENGKIL